MFKDPAEQRVDHARVATLPMLRTLALGVLLITYAPWLTLGLLEWMGRA